MKHPSTTLVRQFDTHRLIPSKYSDESVLTRIADGDAHLRDIFDLDNATNDQLPGIGLSELVFGVLYFRIINAAFTHAHPLGSRFNSPERGARYAGFAIETSQAEVAYHKSLDLAEINLFEGSVTYDDHLADFSATLHDLRGDNGGAAPEFRDCLDRESYVASQALASELMAADSLGIVYPSVRARVAPALRAFGQPW